MNEKPKSCYECKTCGSVITVDADRLNSVQCCKDPELILLWTQTEDPKLKLSEAYEDTINLIQKYMDLERDKCKLIALWILGTYFHKEFSTYPFLFINAMRGSGKTRLLNIISHLSKGSGGEVQTGITESVLFRSPPGETLVLDECESISGKDKAALREYLNACYKKGGVVKRMKKAKIENQEQYVIDKFHPFKPITLANIWGIEEVLGDRCISIILEKSSDVSKTKLIEDFDNNPEFIKIKRTFDQFSVVCAVYSPPGIYITAWNNYIYNRYSNIDIHISTTTLTTLNNTNNTTKEQGVKQILMEELFLKIDNLGISGRNFELLFPLIFLASNISDDITNDILRIGKELMNLKQEDEFVESKDVSLYEFVAKLEGAEMKPMKELTSHFRMWIGDDPDDSINEKWMGKALKRLNLVVEKKRLASGVFVLLNKEKAKKKVGIFQRKEVKDEEQKTT